ncbi:dnaJ homolog subfamily C member 4 [Antennarius striatus]|uniref:dnaJ homolog subfamily C member 4 n=1 Tax=Antennarius striatus TaxID=241820 RepID=UPI0035AFFE4B
MQLKAQFQLCQSHFWFCRSRLRQLSQSHVHRKPVNYYELLGVKSDASLEEIKKAFFRKSKMLHPDRNPSDPTLHCQFVELNEAYRVLSKDLSRKEYDFKTRYPHSGNQAFRSSSSHMSSTSSMGDQDNKRYWEQFHQSYAQTTAEEWQRRKRKNIHVMGYCILIMILGIGVHTLFFRKLQEIHTNFMDEKDRRITQIYNEARERARVNGFKKQMEILRQNQAEYLKKYNTSNDRDDK